MNEEKINNIPEEDAVLIQALQLQKAIDSMSNAIGKLNELEYKDPTGETPTIVANLKEAMESIDFTTFEQIESENPQNYFEQEEAQNHETKIEANNYANNVLRLINDIYPVLLEQKLKEYLPDKANKVAIQQAKSFAIQAVKEMDKIYNEQVEEHLSDK